MKNDSKKEPDLAQKVINLCSRRGMLVQSGEIYGGMAGFFDYLGYGAQLKKNVERAWWKKFVESREDIIGIDGAEITHPRTWEASGHAENFADPLVECGKCKSKFRADHLLEEELKISVDGLPPQKLQELMQAHKLKCQKCGGELSLLNQFNLMFKTSVGAGTEAVSAYLRPETAQLIFTNFKTVANTMRCKLPFGMAQIGKAYRNEISPRNFVFRCREFSQMEIEFFIDGTKLDDCPHAHKYESSKVLVLTAVEQEKHAAGKGGEAKAQEETIGELLRKKTIGSKWMACWIGEVLAFLHELGIQKENLRLRQHVSTELSHYSKETWDVEYNYPWGWKELIGIAYRTDFDLKQHAKHSGANLSIFDQDSGQTVVPHVIEPSFGLDRLFFTLLLDAYNENSATSQAGKDGKEAEGSSILLKLSPKISPVQVAVFPLMKKDGLSEKARAIFESLRSKFVCQFDSAGSIGKRYARMDEIGTPYCITIDYETLEQGTLTIRERDSGKQARVAVEGLSERLSELLSGS